MNFWAEKLTSARLLGKHLLLLAQATHLALPDGGELDRLCRRAQDQAQLTAHLLTALPPSPEFLKTAEFTKLTIQNEQISLCLKILNLLQSVGKGKDGNLKE